MGNSSRGSLLAPYPCGGGVVTPGIPAPPERIMGYSVVVVTLVEKIES